MKHRPQDICERTFHFALQIVKACQKLDKKPGVNRTISQQLLRSGTSVGANVEEAQAGQSRADFISKCAIALKESRETHYWLRLLKASKIDFEQQDFLLQEAHEISRILGSIIKNTKAK